MEAYTGAAIDRIADLCKNASGCTTVIVKTDGLGDGLPEAVPMLFDHRAGGQGLVSVKDQIEQWRQNPQRRRGEAVATTLKSFVDLLLYHKDESSALFAHTGWPAPQLLAVIDYHTTDHKPRHLAHRISYKFPITDEFKDWVDHDTKPFTQAEFAAFIEDHAADLASPLPAEKSEFENLFRGTFAPPNVMVVLSRGLQVHVEAVVKHHVTLQSGEGEIMFAEEHLDKKGEKINVPNLFMVSCAAFTEGVPVRIPARLRYRVSGGKVSWFYQLYRWKDCVRQRVTEDLHFVFRETEVATFEGAPEK